MDESEFDEELYDVASAYDIASDVEDHNNFDYHGYESDSSGLFVHEHIPPPHDFVDEDEDGLDFDHAPIFHDFSDNEFDLDLAQAEDEDISDVQSDYSLRPDLDEILRELEHEEGPASPARIASETPARSHYDLDSEIDVEELLGAAIAVDRERQLQSLEDHRRRFNEQLAIQGYSPVHIESDDDSDILQGDDPHSPASDDLFTLATPSVASGSASTATSQSSESSAPHRASRLDQAGSSRRPIELLNPPQNNNHQNHNFGPGYRRQQQDRAYRPQFPPAGVAPALASSRPLVPFQQPPARNHSNSAPHRRQRQEPSILLEDDDEAEDELIMMEYGRSRRAQQPPPAPPRGSTFIDLTEEPDSPVQGFALPPPPPPAPQANQPRANPRRSNSLNHRAPSLNRSDGSNLPGRSFIDLTDDSPEPHRPHLPHHRQAGGFGNPGMAQPGAVNNPQAAADDDVSIIGAIQRFGLSRINVPAFPRAFLPGAFFSEAPAAPAAANQNNNRHRQPPPPPPPRPAPVAQVGINGLHNAVLAVMAGHPLHNNPIGLDYRHNGFGIPNYPMAHPKPDFVPPKPAREGFTRDTGKDDLVPVCASCEEELSYDADAHGEPAAKRARTKKDREEHHFWALVDCGHVYCKDCYENRKPAPSSKSTSKRAAAADSNKDPGKVNFRQGPTVKHILCAVDECETEVSHKKAWVGLFL